MAWPNIFCCKFSKNLAKNLFDMSYFSCSDGVDLFCVVFLWRQFINEQMEQQRKRPKTEMSEQKMGKKIMHKKCAKDGSFKANYDNSFLPLPSLIEVMPFVNYFFTQNHRIHHCYVARFHSFLSVLLCYKRTEAPLSF